jgi:hypothetical protein
MSVMIHSSGAQGPNRKWSIVSSRLSSDPTVICSTSLPYSTYSGLSMDDQLPTLGDVLLNNASPPWTLHAFTAHLNRHCCLEALQFVLDSQHYATCYEGFVRSNVTSSNNSDTVALLWRKLIKLYILPSGQRQLNIPELEREYLLHLPPEPPPRPSELRGACQCAYNLLNDSLTAFFRTPKPMLDIEEPRPSPEQQARSHSRRRRDALERPKFSACTSEPGGQMTGDGGNTSFVEHCLRWLRYLCCNKSKAS